MLTLANSAGPYFECAVEWDATSHADILAYCGGGKGAKLMAELKITVHPEVIIAIELKICVDVISDVISMIGKFIPAFETLMNEQFNIYGGCLRLAIATYNVPQNRLETAMSYKKRIHGTLFTLEIAANCKSEMLI